MTPIRLHDSNAAKGLDFSRYRHGEAVRDYWIPLMRKPSTWIRNIDTRCLLLEVDEWLLPVTVNEEEYDNSYVCSPHTQYIGYVRDELRILENPLLRMGVQAGLAPLGGWMRRARINRIVFVNNWLLSTNLHVPLSRTRTHQVAQFLQERFPDHAIAYRSLTELLHAQWMQDLTDVGHDLIPSRQIYLFHKDDDRRLSRRERSRMKQDLRLLQSSDYEVMEPEAIHADDAERIIDLYEQLYIHKYSRHNPQFTPLWIRRALETGFLHIQALRKEGRINGVIGYWIRDEWMTAPLLGYDRTRPQKEGLYRMLTALLTLEGKRRGLHLHLSGGAGKFKLYRGAASAIEYSAVLTRHLPVHRRIAWRALTLILKQAAVPLVKIYQA